MPRCKGCLTYRKSYRYGLCEECRLLPRHRWPTNVAIRGRPKPLHRAQVTGNPVCACHRPYETLTLEEASEPCPHMEVNGVRLQVDAAAA